MCEQITKNVTLRAFSPFAPCYSTLFIYCTSLSYDMERLKVLEEEQEMLNSSLIALTTHFAQVLNWSNSCAASVRYIKCSNVENVTVTGSISFETNRRRTSERKRNIAQRVRRICL